GPWGSTTPRRLSSPRTARPDERAEPPARGRDGGTARCRRSLGACGVVWSRPSGKETNIDTLSTAALIYGAAVLILAYGLRGTTGFGGVAGMPLLAVVVPMKLLVPVWTLLGIASSLTIFGRERQHVSYRHILRVLPGCVVGI